MVKSTLPAGIARKRGGMMGDKGPMPHFGLEMLNEFQIMRKITCGLIGAPTIKPHPTAYPMLRGLPNIGDDSLDA